MTHPDVVRGTSAIHHVQHVRFGLGGSVLVVALIAAGCGPLGTKGTMPPPGPDGEVNRDVIPDFIAVAAQDGGIAGYVSKEYVFPEPTKAIGRPGEVDWPVYADDLRTLVGHMVAGKGFVPLGVDPESVPERPVQVGPSNGVAEPSAR